MTDPSAVIIWTLLLVSSCIAIGLGRVMRGSKKLGDVIVSGILALLLAIGVTIAIVYALDICAKVKFCSSGSDTSLGFLLYPIVQAPLNWLLMLVLPSKSRIEQ